MGNDSHWINQEEGGSLVVMSTLMYCMNYHYLNDFLCTYSKTQINVYDSCVFRTFLHVIITCLTAV